MKTDGRNVYRILHSCSFRTHCIWHSKTICHVQHEILSVLIFVHPTLLVSDCTLTKTKVYIYPKQAVRRTRKKNHSNCVNWPFCSLTICLREPSSTTLCRVHYLTHCVMNFRLLGGNKSSPRNRRKRMFIAYTSK